MRIVIEDTKMEKEDILSKIKELQDRLHLLEKIEKHYGCKNSHNHLNTPDKYKNMNVEEIVLDIVNKHSNGITGRMIRDFAQKGGSTNTVNSFRTVTSRLKAKGEIDMIERQGITLYVPKNENKSTIGSLLDRLGDVT